MRDFRGTLIMKSYYTKKKKSLQLKVTLRINYSSTK